MPFPVTINGNTYTLDNFAPYNYTIYFPNIIQDVATVAQTVADMAAAGGFTQAEASIASAATTDIGAATAAKLLITGTTTITSFGSSPNRLRFLRFAGALTLTHNATSLVLPGGASITTAAGDTAIATSDASGNWRVRAYQKASGKPVVGLVAADITDSTVTGRSVLTAADAAAGATALGLGTGNSPTWNSGSFSTGAVVLGGQLSFNNRVENLITFFGGYTMGIQSSTVFIRTPNDFCVYMNGAYTQNQADPGSGGTRLLRLNSSLVEFGARLGLVSFTVATLPAGANGSLIYVSNARKVGELTGTGTGVVAYYSNSNWRRQSDDTAVAA